MNLEVSEMQTQIASSAAAFLSDKLPITRLRALAAAGGPALSVAEWMACAI